MTHASKKIRERKSAGSASWNWGHWRGCMKDDFSGGLWRDTVMKGWQKKIDQKWSVLVFYHPDQILPVLKFRCFIRVKSRLNWNPADVGIIIISVALWEKQYSMYSYPSISVHEPLFSWYSHPFRCCNIGYRVSIRVIRVKSFFWIAIPTLEFEVC